jgi:nitroreductase/NAD-dependent dihydropyrimidine dehydrogenase PreA subunit
MEILLRIDEDKCIGCGICTEDCISKIIEIIDGKAMIEDHTNCILCGHCGAVCPEEAIRFISSEESNPVAEFKDFKNVEYKELNQMIKMKRSIRQYKDQAVEMELIEKILEIGRVSPTAGNRQPLKFTVINNPEKIEELKLMVMNTLYEFSQNSVGRYKTVFGNMLKNYLEDGYDRLFYNAPSLIVVYGDPKASGMLDIDSAIAAGQMTLIAETLGLGSCFVGFLNTAAEKNNEINKFLKIPEGNKMIVNFILGYPDVKYYRTVPRNKLNVNYL